MVLQLGKHFLAQTGGDLGVNLGVLDILMVEVICDVLNPLAGFQEMHNDGAAQAVNGASCNACPGHFSALFRAHVALTPTAYRDHTRR